MNNKSKVIIIFFLIIIVSVLCYYIIINKDKNIVNVPVAIDYIKKEYNDKDYVFDTSYSNEDIVFPYVNLNYNNVNSINFQIKDLYERNSSNITSASYEFFINDKILSIVIKVNIDDKDNYYTYNINMKNGREILFDDVYYKYNQNDNKLKDKISEYIDNSEEIKSYMDELVLSNEYVTNINYNNYKTNALSNNVKFYLGKSNSLNVVIKIDLDEIYYEYAVFEL